MGIKMRWLVALVVLSASAYCKTITADEDDVLKQDRMEYGEPMPVDDQAKQDDDMLADQLAEGHLAEEDIIIDADEGRSPLNHDDIDVDNELLADRQEEEEESGNDGTAEVQSWNALPTKYRGANIEFIHISTSINYFWGTDKSNRIYRCARPCNGAWVRVPGGLKQVDVGDMEVWGVNGHHHIYKRSADGAGGWVRVSGLLKHVSASGNGYIWGVNRNDDIFMCKKPCSGRWTHIGGKLKQIDGGERYVFGVNSANNMFRRQVDSKGSWTPIRSRIKMKYVSVGADKVYGVAASNSKVYQCRLPCTTGTFTAIDTCLNMEQVEAAVGKIIGTTDAGQLMKRKVA